MYIHRVIGCLGLLAGLVVSAWAGLQVEPQLVEMRSVPGVPSQGILTVTNTGESALSVQVEVEPWQSTDPRDLDLAVTSWLQVQPAQLELSPQQSEAIRYVLTLPVGMTGERAAMVFLADKVLQQSGSVSIRTRLGTPLYAIAQGTEQVDLTVESVSLSTYDTRGQETTSAQWGIRGTTVVQNRGNVHVRPVGTVTVYPTGPATEATPVAAITLQSGHPVYPKSQRAFFGFWKEGRLDPGRYRAVCHIDYGEWYGVARSAEQTALFTVNGAGEILMDLKKGT